MNNEFVDIYYSSTMRDGHEKESRTLPPFHDLDKMASWIPYLDFRSIFFYYFWSIDLVMECPLW